MAAVPRNTKVHLTIPTSYRISRSGGERYVIHDANLAPEEITRIDAVTLTTIRRTLTDALGSVSAYLLRTAIETARDRTRPRCDRLGRPRRSGAFAGRGPGPMTGRPRGANEFQRLLQRHAADACTEPLPNGNDRVRDIVDIWLLEALLEPGDLSAVRAACIEVFRRRQRQAWPPTVSPSPSWTRDYPLLVAEHPDARPALDDAIGDLTRLAARIDWAS